MLKINAQKILIRALPALLALLCLRPAAALAGDYLAVACLRRNADLCGLINEKGEWLVSPAFDRIDDFAPNGLAVAVQSRRAGLINARGEWVLPPEFDQVAPDWSADLVKVTRIARGAGRLYGLANEAGRLVVEPSFLEIQPFGPNRLAGACDQEGRCGFIDTQGAWAVAPVFAQVDAFAANGLAPARPREETRWGYIDATGAFVIPPSFDLAFPFDGDRAKVMIEGLYGLINAKGQRVGRLQAASLGDFDAASKLAPAQKEADGPFGLVNRNGGWVVSPRFERLLAFGAGGLAPAKKDGLFGFINRSGHWVIKPAFGNVDDFETQSRNRRAPAEMSGAWGLIDARGRWVVEPDYIMLLNSGRQGDPLHVMTEKGLWGLMDENGQWLLEPVLNAVPFFAENGLSEAKVGEMYGFIDRAGRWVVEPSFQQVGMFRPVPAGQMPQPVQSAAVRTPEPEEAPVTKFQVETAKAAGPARIKAKKPAPSKEKQEAEAEAAPPPTRSASRKAPAPTRFVLEKKTAAAPPAEAEPRAGDGEDRAEAAGTDQKAGLAGYESDGYLPPAEPEPPRARRSRPAKPAPAAVPAAAPPGLVGPPEPAGASGPPALTIDHTRPQMTFIN